MKSRPGRPGAGSGRTRSAAAAPEPPRRGSPASTTRGCPAGWCERPLTAGWAGPGFWAALIVADEFLDLAGWSWYVMVGMAALPTLLATLALLHATPRTAT